MKKNNKLNTERTYLDPIHGPIQLNLKNSTDALLAKIINSKEFQRLRRIKQMGLGWFTFHGAEHSRFGHSLGTLHIARSIISKLSKQYPDIKSHTTEILVSALIHDIGHGPFSHTAEKLTKYNHEDWTSKIITGNSEINKILKKHNPSLPRKITNILKHKTKPVYLSQLISSYIDCDRLDYLHRDSYFIGVPYGLTGSDRIIASLEIDKKTKRIIINENIGLDAVIHYLQARHSMYQQIYQHKKNLSCDFLLKNIIKIIKAKKLKDTPLSIQEWLNFRGKSFSSLNLDLYLQTDDVILLNFIQLLAYSDQTEKTLKDLCDRFTNRKLFKSLEFRKSAKKERLKSILEKAKLIAQSKKLDPNYYVGFEQSSSKPYEPYQALKKTTSKAIFIKQKNGAIKEISHVSSLVKALSQENVVKTCLVFAPELEDEIYKIKGIQELVK